MKKLFCILLSALMLASCMTGCNKAEETTPTTPAVTTEPAPTGPVAPMDEKYDSITIAGVDQVRKTTQEAMLDEGEIVGNGDVVVSEYN